MEANRKCRRKSCAATALTSTLLAAGKAYPVSSIRDAVRLKEKRLLTFNSRINTAGLGQKHANATDVSRGIFGGTVGVDRLLNLFKKYGIKATFFIPGHSAESFREQVEKIRDAGHEM